MSLPLAALLKTKRFQLTNPLYKLAGYCDACGKTVKFRMQPIITDSLTSDWQLSLAERWRFDRRESLFCENCSNSLRTRQLARTLVTLYGKDAKCLGNLVDESGFANLGIAEINSCGNLRQFFHQPNVSYSEFESKDKRISNEDLQQLSYKDNSFDLVLTSETLEHVPDLKRSLAEIYRVLKPGGRHIFTVPIILNRKSRDRIRVTEKGTMKELLHKSYHGEETVGFLVVREIGGDFIDILEENGFKTALYYTYPLYDTHSYVFVCTKV